MPHDAPPTRHPKLSGLPQLSFLSRFRGALGAPALGRGLGFDLMRPLFLALFISPTYVAVILAFIPESDGLLKTSGHSASPFSGLSSCPSITRLRFGQEKHEGDPTSRPASQVGKRRVVPNARAGRALGDPMKARLKPKRYRYEKSEVKETH
jgi:hypothetical protein